MSDPHDHPTGAAGELTEEQLRASLEQLRNADVAEILAQAFNLLGTGAEVKLGRDDARVLIDALAAMVNAAERGLPEQLVAQMRQGLSNLQVAQVQAEREAAGGDPATRGAAGSDQATGQPPADAGQQAAAAGKQAGQQPGQQPGGKMTDRLWIPGRGE